MNQDKILQKLKKDIRSLLISSKLGLDPEQLRRDYVSLLGHPLPLAQLGFTNIMDMVTTMPDVVSINFRQDGTIYLKGVGGESTQNIEELVAKQRTSKADNQRFKRGHRSYCPPRFYHQSPHVLLPRRGLAPPAIPAKLRAQLLKLLSTGPIRLSDLETSFLHCFGHPLHVQNFGFYSTQEMLRTAADLFVIHQDRLGSVVSLRTMWGPHKTKMMNGTCPVNGVQKLTETQGVSSRVPMSAGSPPLSETTVAPIQKHSVPVSNKPEVQETNHEEGQLFEKLLQKLEKEFCNQIVENGVAGTISQELKDKLRKVVSQAGGELSVHDVPAEYKRFYGEELPLLQSGFVSVTELVDAMSDTLVLKPAERDSGQHWLVSVVPDSDALQTGVCGLEYSDLKEAESLDMEQPSPSYYLSRGKSLWESKQEDADDEAVIPADLGHAMELSTEPQLNLHYGSTVPPDALKSQRLKKPTRYAERDVVQVLVEHVESPGLFYVSFCDSEEARTTEDMMIEMRRCYRCPEVSERYSLPERFVRRGQVCCVCPEGMWFYRVVIHQILSPTHVKVYFVDFGNMTVVPSNRLKFLKARYSELPARAVQSALAGIKPTKGSWTLEAAASFQKLCTNNPLVGALACYTGDVLHLYLCDTRKENDVYIHKVLLSEGHGIACSPSAREELCACVIPVSMYLGEGTLDLPDIKEEPSLTPVSHSSKVEEVDLPGLELIEDSDSCCHIQDEDSSCFSVDQSVTFSETDPTGTEPTSPPRAMCTSAALPDFIQSTPTVTVDLKGINEALPAPPSLNSSDGCPPSQEQQNPLMTTATYVERTLPFWRAPDLRTSGLGQGVLFHRRTSGFSFPVFGAR
ncbi:tudor domain-containing protein 5 isoform X1 [Takifugu flavidus]|uniref:tudor domain-containing protein 5 isoform X1 n=1 Tax=Takifugu flavidus TaxID=433684 RepID=UPI002544BC11|nr:tudor domain-containing protein 5 isoform X1 [Takifugu flavidus]